MLCIYSGGDSGFEERDALLSWLKKLDSRKYLVIKTEYYNRPNNPPMPVLVVNNNLCICIISHKNFVQPKPHSTNCAGRSWTKHRLQM